MTQAHPIGERAFQHEVIESDIPVLVDFYADWCMPCRMLAPIIDRLAQQFEGRVRVVKVNVDHAPALAMRYQVRSIPTLVLMDRGRVIENHSGILAPDRLVSMLESAVRGPAVS